LWANLTKTWQKGEKKLTLNFKAKGSFIGFPLKIDEK
jgi:hypothetical protein